MLASAKRQHEPTISIHMFDSEHSSQDNQCEPKLEHVIPLLKPSKVFPSHSPKSQNLNNL